MRGTRTSKPLRHHPTYAAVEAGWGSEMRDELRMDYIERLNRAAIPLGTIVVLSSGAALAQDQLTKADLVQLAVHVRPHRGSRSRRRCRRRSVSSFHKAVRSPCLAPFRPLGPALIRR